MPTINQTAATPAAYLPDTAPRSPRAPRAAQMALRLMERLDRGTLELVLPDGSHRRFGDGQGPRAYLDRQPYFQTMPRLLVHETAIHWIDT